MALIYSKKDCCSCGVCEQICPTNALSTKCDSLGFLRPVINKNNCVDCGMCNNVCPAQRKINNMANHECYAAYTKDKSVLEISSSGGVFFTIAQTIIDEGGQVCGCILDEEFQAKHILVDNKGDLYRLIGSKYVQSDIREVIPMLKNVLKNGVTVLFVGTPCQVYAVKQYLGDKLCSNLLCIDLVCHGTPSRKMFYDYIKYIEKRRKIKIHSYCFRNKLHGWKHAPTILALDDENNAYDTLAQLKNEYYYLYFLWGYQYNSSCYVCKFANANRVGDITLGDFWNIDKILDDENLKKGTSLVLTNTDKGKYWFNKTQKLMISYNVPIEYALSENKQLVAPTTCNKFRNGLIMLIYRIGGARLENALFKLEQSLKQ